MEHRCGERLALQLPAVLHLPGGEKIRCVINDLSSGGAFVTLPPVSQLPQGQLVLEVCLPYARPQRCRWTASVVHRQEHGIGLMFDELQLGDVLPFLAANRRERLQNATPREGSEHPAEHVFAA